MPQFVIEFECNQEQVPGWGYDPNDMLRAVESDILRTLSPYSPRILRSVVGGPVPTDETPKKPTVVLDAGDRTMIQIAAMSLEEYPDDQHIVDKAKATLSGLSDKYGMLPSDLVDLAKHPQ